MMSRLLLVVAVAANVAVAGMSVTSSAWLWTRAAEPIARPEVIPALPTFVGETSVPYRAAPRKASRARLARRAAVLRRARNAATRRVVRRIAVVRPVVPAASLAAAPSTTAAASTASSGR